MRWYIITPFQVYNLYGIDNYSVRVRVNDTYAERSGQNYRECSMQSCRLHFVVWTMHIGRYRCAFHSFVWLSNILCVVLFVIQANRIQEFSSFVNENKKEITIKSKMISRYSNCTVALMHYSTLWYALVSSVLVAHFPL